MCVYACVHLCVCAYVCAGGRVGMETGAVHVPSFEDRYSGQSFPTGLH